MITKQEAFTILTAYRALNYEYLKLCEIVYEGSDELDIVMDEAIDNNDKFYKMIEEITEKR